MFGLILLVRVGSLCIFHPKVDDPKLLEESMERFFNWAQGSAIAREVLGDKLLDVDGL